MSDVVRCLVMFGSVVQGILVWWGWFYSMLWYCVAWCGMMGCVMLYSGVPKKVKQRNYQASKGKAVPFKYGFKPHRKRVRILVQIMESNTFI